MLAPRDATPPAIASVWLPVSINRVHWRRLRGARKESSSRRRPSVGVRPSTVEVAPYVSSPVARQPHTARASFPSSDHTRRTSDRWRKKNRLSENDERPQCRTRPLSLLGCRLIFRTPPARGSVRFSPISAQVVSASGSASARQKVGATPRLTRIHPPTDKRETLILPTHSSRKMFENWKAAAVSLSLALYPSCKPPCFLYQRRRTVLLHGARRSTSHRAPPPPRLTFLLSLPSPVAPRSVRSGAGPCADTAD